MYIHMYIIHNYNYVYVHIVHTYIHMYTYKQYVHPYTLIYVQANCWQITKVFISLKFPESLISLSHLVGYSPNFSPN